METEGVFSFDDADSARETYAALGPAARTVVRETARAMGFDREEYGDRVTGEVVETARDALFASLLSVRVGTREEYEAWLEEYDGPVHETGSERVDRAAWHVPGFADEAVATTFQDEREAAVGTLRRQAFGRVYRGVLYDGTDGGGANGGGDDAEPATGGGR
ncbi:MAG: DUF5809 family protein [Haloferacaceae archaeon]